MSNISAKKLKEISFIEADINEQLKHLRNGKLSYILTCEDKEVADLIVERYTKAGWLVVIKYSGEQMFRLDFEDLDQPTRKYKAIR